MNRFYQYGPILVKIISSPPKGSYLVSLEMGAFISSPVQIDAHYGADHASKIALETYLKALTDPETFIARERLEASLSHPSEVRTAEEWASRVIGEAQGMGSALEEAVREASTPTIEDVTEQINTYLALLEFAWQVEIETLLAQGYSQQNAEQEVLKRGVERTKERWALVPRLRPPCGVHG